MKCYQIDNPALLLLLFFGLVHCNPPTTRNDYLIRFNDTIKDEYGYRNLKGDTVITLGKYMMCFTDTLRTYAIVIDPREGFVAIDRHEKVLYKVFPFDNGPDQPSDGLFRIMSNNKLGYADFLTGKVVIKPQYECAWPFENGAAKVSTDCKTQQDGEHSIWLSDYWYYIDKTGKKIEKPETNSLK